MRFFFQEVSQVQDKNETPNNHGDDDDNDDEDDDDDDDEVDDEDEEDEEDEEENDESKDEEDSDNLDHSKIKDCLEIIRAKEKSLDELKKVNSTNTVVVIKWPLMVHSFSP